MKGRFSARSESARRFCRTLNLRRIRLLTNRPKKVAALEGFGIEIVEQVPVELKGVKR